MATTSASSPASATVPSGPGAWWRRAALFDACAAPFRGANDLAALLPGIDLVAHVVVPPSSTAAGAHAGLIILADASGNLHAVCGHAPATPTAPPRLRTDSFPVADDGAHITALAVQRSSTTTTSNAPVVLLVGLDDPAASAPAVRIVHYRPNGDVPWTIVKSVSLAHAASGLLAGLSKNLSLALAASTGASPHRASLTPLGAITHLAVTPPSPHSGVVATCIAFTSGAILLVKSPPATGPNPPTTPSGAPSPLPYAPSPLADLTASQAILAPGSKHIMLRTESPTDPVTGLVCTYPSHLVITTRTHIWTVVKDQLVDLDKDEGTAVPPIPVPPPDVGAVPALMASRNAGHVLIIRSKGLVLYSTESGKGPTYPFTHVKSCSFIGPYLAIVSSSGSPDLVRDSLALYHLEHKLCVYSAHVAPVHLVAPLGGTRAPPAAGADSILVVTDGARTSDVQVLRLKEKPLPARLDELQTAGQFPAALAVAARELAGAGAASDAARTVLADLHGAYAAHLLSQGDGAGALAQFIQTVGTWEPSRVVRALSGATHMDQLVAYLHHLHRTGRAASEHSQLLFTCLIRGRNRGAIDDLVSSGVEFDVDAAITCCLHGGLPDVAVGLATRFEMWEALVVMLVRDVKDYKGALALLRPAGSKLPRRARIGLWRRVGAALVAHVPQETTQVLVATVVGEVPDDGESLATTVRDLARLLPPPPEPYAQSFYLATVVKEAKVVEVVPAEVWDAALAACTEASAAMQVLEHPKAKCTPAHALLLAKSRHWRSALAFLYSRSGTGAKDLLALHAESGNVPAMLQVCHEYGAKDPDLWRRVVAYLADRYDPEDNADPLKQVLAYVDAKGVMAPVEVLAVVARNGKVPFGVVKEVFAKRIAREKAVIAENEALVQTYRQETKKMKDEIVQLETQPVTFQVPTCAACNHALTLPTHHFLCKHSYHASCLNETASGPPECPKCIKAHRKAVALQRTLAEQAGEDFFGKLEAADDGFAVVADWFSRKAIR
ncbi:Vacuolar protein sorting-associated protein 11 [Allomyces arbusculus]|nr:Vacuolar protein sorting-associated protein 11 [Allomyces arbusculus]